MQNEKFIDIIITFFIIYLHDFFQNDYHNHY